MNCKLCTEEWITPKRLLIVRKIFTIPYLCEYDVTQCLNHPEMFWKTPIARKDEKYLNTMTNEEKELIKGLIEKMAI